MYANHHPGLGASLEEFTARRLRQTWQRSGDTVEGTAGKGWFDPEAFGSEEGEDEANVSVIEPVAAPTFAAPVISAPMFSYTEEADDGFKGDDESNGGGGGSTAVTEDASTTSNTPPESSPGAEDASTASTDPVGSGPVETITVQLRNAGNFNGPDANTSLRFSMPGLGGALCAVGAALSQLPAGSTSNTYILGEWILTGQWAPLYGGCTFVASSAQEVRSGYVDASDIPAQETPFTPGPGYCPPGQIPKSETADEGCYEPCPMRSQRWDADLQRCVDIVCPSGTIVGAYGECVTVEQTEAGPVGCPVGEHWDEVAGRCVSDAVTFLPPEEAIVTDYLCEPGTVWNDWAGECLRITDGHPVEDTEIPEGKNGDDEYYDDETQGTAAAQGCPEGHGLGQDGKCYPLADWYIEEVLTGTTDTGGSGGGGIGPGGDGGDETTIIIEGGGGGYGGAPGSFGPGGGPALSPGEEGDGFGIAAVAIGAGLAWVLSQAYERAF